MSGLLEMTSNFSVGAGLGWVDPLATHPLLPQRSSTVIGSCVMSASVVVGVCGTTWLIAAMIGAKEVLSSVVNICIFSLSVNDLLNLFSNQLLVTGSYMAHGWPFGEFLCHFMPECNMFLVSSSLWHHALIAIHRYIAVCHDSWYRGTSKTVYVVILVVGTRVIPSAICLPAMFESMSEYDPKLLRCVTKAEKRLRTLVVFVSTIVLPCCIVLTSFVLIVLFMCRTKRRSLVHRHHLQSLSNVKTGTGGNSSSLHREIQITKMFGAVFGVMFAGFIPYGLLRSLDNQRVHGNVYVAMSVLYAIASAANPVVYGAMNRQIRAMCIAACSRRLARRAPSAKRPKRRTCDLADASVSLLPPTTNTVTVTVTTTASDLTTLDNDASANLNGNANANGDGSGNGNGNNHCESLVIVNVNVNQGCDAAVL